MQGDGIMKNLVFLLAVCFLLSGCDKLGGDGRYEVKNMKLPVRTIIDANTTVTYQDEIVRIDTRTGKAWKLQHGTSNIAGYTCEFSMWDELGNTYRPSDKKTGLGK